MYRIIGITKNTKLFKIIKKTPINQGSSTTFYWHNIDNQNIKWNVSDLYKGLNGISGGKYSNLFIGNKEYFPSGEKWEEKIAIVNWRYGDLYHSSDWVLVSNITASQMAQIEQGWSTTVSAKIG